MALEPTAELHLLPCGRSVEDVFDELEIGQLDTHSQHCPHCQSAAASLEVLHRATGQLLADPVEPSGGLFDRIMSVVRAELRRGPTLPLPAALGPAEVAVRAVAVLLRYAADTVPGVRARGCQLQPDPEDPSTVHIHMSLSVRYRGQPIEPLVQQVRSRVAAAMRGQVGLDAGTIDLDVVDVWDRQP